MSRRSGVVFRGASRSNALRSSRSPSSRARTGTAPAIPAGAAPVVVVSSGESIVGPIVAAAAIDLIGRPVERNPGPGGIADLAASREILDTRDPQAAGHYRPSRG